MKLRTWWIWVALWSVAFTIPLLTTDQDGGLIGFALLEKRQELGSVDKKGGGGGGRGGGSSGSRGGGSSGSSGSTSGSSGSMGSSGSGSSPKGSGNANSGSSEPESSGSGSSSNESGSSGGSSSGSSGSSGSGSSGGSSGSSSPPPYSAQDPNPPPAYAGGSSGSSGSGASNPKSGGSGSAPKYSGSPSSYYNPQLSPNKPIPGTSYYYGGSTIPYYGGLSSPYGLVPYGVLAGMAAAYLGMGSTFHWANGVNNDNENTVYDYNSTVTANNGTIYNVNCFCLEDYPCSCDKPTMLANDTQQYFKALPADRYRLVQAEANKSNEYYLYVDGTLDGNKESVNSAVKMHGKGTGPIVAAVGMLCWMLM